MTTVSCRICEKCGKKYTYCRSGYGVSPEQVNKDRGVTYELCADCNDEVDKEKDTSPLWQLGETGKAMSFSGNSFDLPNLKVLLDKAKAEYEKIMSKRDEYVKAWIAETGLKPSESEIVEQRNYDGSVVMFVRKRRIEEK